MATNNQVRIMAAMSEASLRELEEILADDYTVDTVETAARAKDLLDRNRYRAVILDEELPNEGWREVLEFLREKDLHLPVLVCTAEVGGKGVFAESKHDETFVSDVLMRPFSPQIVRSRIQSAVSNSGDSEHEGATRPSHPLE